MKKLAVVLLSLSLVALFSENLKAEDVAAPQAAETITPRETPDAFAQAEALIDAGGLDNCKKALDLCLGAIEKESGSYRANWITAMACREYGNEAKKAEVPGWEEICKVQGKAGMGYAEKAKALDPAKVEGHYWYGMNVGIYSDGVSILTALKEGLKDKTQTSFETAYKINKMYDKGGPIGALARFWQVLPWPLNDKDKSMTYYREFQKTPFFDDPDAVEARVYFAELLMDSRKTRKEAREILTKTIEIADEPYWRKKAQAMLKDL